MRSKPSKRLGNCTVKIQKHSKRKTIPVSLQYKENLKHVEIERARFLWQQCFIFSRVESTKQEICWKLSYLRQPLLHRIKPVHMMKLVSAPHLRFFFCRIKAGAQDGPGKPVIKDVLTYVSGMESQWFQVLRHCSYVLSISVINKCLKLQTVRKLPSPAW
jgi:hypothetical protein